MTNIEHYASQFENLAGTLPGVGIDWIDQKRRDGMVRFSEVGFPSLQDEDWRYTSLRPVTGKSFALAPAVPEIDVDIDEIPGLDSYRVIFADGHLHSGLPLDLNSGITITTLSRCLQENPELVRDYLGVCSSHNHGLTELNNAMHQDGIVVVLDDGAVLECPLELVFTSSAVEGLVQPRNLVIAGEGARARVIERYVSAGDVPSLCNGVTEVFLGEGANVEHYLVQTSSARSYQVNGVWAKQQANSRFKCLTFTLGGALVRNDIRASLDQLGAHCDMLGTYSLEGKQHVDNHTTMNHRAPNCTSRELYKGVLNQRSRGVFHGRIKVHQDAQQTDAQQANNTLLLSGDAEIDTKPQLEIYADDVKCSHGATIGQLDEASLFYLRSRGIEEIEARSMLTFAFVNEVLEEVSIDALKSHLESLLATQLIPDDRINGSAQ